MHTTKKAEPMTYTTTTEKHGYREAVVDLARFAVDLAAELGARVLPPSGDGPHYPGENQTIDLGDNNHLHLFSNRYAMKGRVGADLWAVDVKHDDRNFYDKSHKTTAATVNPEGRSIAAIAKDIKKRVIDANAAALAAQRAYRDQRHQGAAQLAETAAQLSRAFPQLEFTFDPKDLRGAIRGHAPVYLSGRFDAAGRISLDRIDWLNPEAFAALATALGLNKPKPEPRAVAVQEGEQWLGVSKTGKLNPELYDTEAEAIAAAEALDG